ncbi:MAG: PKD domain-containing protein [Bacteroidota bacterium]|nr:PKD domain-containing protein [Bacteroidota bacterium]
MKRAELCLLLFLTLGLRLHSQFADFSIPDTVCVNAPVNIINTSTNATNYYWNFCSGSLNLTPAGSNFASPNLSMPCFLDIVQEGPNFYVFVVNHTGSLSRMDFGNSLLNAPTITNLGSFGGIIPFQAEGIEIEQEGTNWIGYIIGGQFANSRLLKLSFGASVANIPTATNLGNIGNLDYPVDFTLIQDGGNWYGFTVSADNNTVTRFSFGNSLNNIPVATNLGNIGNLNYPVGLFILKDVNNYHLFIANRNSNSISRLDFGTSVANLPTGVNLGNPGNHLNTPRDITVIKDCDKVFGFVTNEVTNAVTRLDFNNNILSVPATTDLGNVGNLSFPASISKIFRTGDAVNFFSGNVNSNSISRITFNNCSASSIPSYIGPTPPPFQYSQPGEYNISLFVDEGLATQSVVCKKIVVRDCGRALSGIINDYTEVLALDPCKNILTVANAGAYNVGDTVLLIQMKGAVIDSSNTAAFGTVTDYKNAGNYEFNYVKSKTGNSIELKNFLTRQYDIPDGKVQLVRVPYYTDAAVTSAITCLPWDGSKGGVVALNIRDTLTMVNGIDVSYKGFRGGIDPVSNPSSFNCYENQFYYPPNPDLASGKGEGIASISSQKSFGKGALANGGGGGNSHNSGGGGGSNGTAGGFGGYNFEGAPCNTTVPFDNRGIGGKALSYNNASNKIFMGGGGGAGHTNNPEGFQALGGNGGGIIIVSANTLMSGTGGFASLGMTAPPCSGLGQTGCHEGMGGGGAGGTILLNIDNFGGDLRYITKGGQGGNTIVGGFGRLGPGGGASGGVTWFKSPSLPANIASQADGGGINGVNTEYTNDPWGATPGEEGLQVFNLQIPIDNIPFKPNIDSVKIKDSVTGCASFDFKGLGYTNTNPVAGWQWYFGDGNTANSQNTNHTYASSGTFTVKLVVTDINGCKDSIFTQVIAEGLNFDFSYDINACSPLSVQFTGFGTTVTNAYWNFGDGNFVNNVSNPIHTYATAGNYIVKYSVSNGTCTDTITKNVSITIIPDNVILTPDTTICPGAVKQLHTVPSLNFCWAPTTYLNDPNSPEPITSTPQDITYFFTTQTTGTNLIVNNDFSQGNTGFTSQYTYKPPPNVLEGQYYIGTNPQVWNAGMVPCTDHTTGTGNMMLVNGSPSDNVIVWSQTVPVQPNTNYAFSAWIENITILNPSTLQFSINGINIGSVLQASNTSCLWQQFYTTWNSGISTTAVISLVNKNLILNGNDFALDDISFAPVFIKRDSVKITVDHPVVKTNNDTTGCPGIQVQLNATGATGYSWFPPAGLNNPAISNPLASPLTTTQYIVSGTSASGCIAKDTVNIIVNPKPVVNASNDTAICKNSSLQLFAGGGGTYAWTPTATLNDPTIPNPVASPTTNTTYYVTVTGTNTCINTDSVKVSLHPDPVFTINPPITICDKDSVRLTAGGGNIYTWQPDPSLNNPAIANPVATPAVTTIYSVNIQETVCNNSATLTTTVIVNPLPVVRASKSNDLDCSNDRSQLNATGAATYVWTPASSLNNPVIANPVALPVINTQYVVKGTDASGCSNYDSVTVNFASVNTSGYFMPNAFTPNHDGLNDCYGIRYWGVIQQLEFSIYNRWGQRIFFTTDPNACWDGMYNGKMQDIGVYVYMIKAKTLCGDTFKKGLFTLVR